MLPALSVQTDRQVEEFLGNSIIRGGAIPDIP